MTTKNVRVRMAPSPTGMVHLGSLRTALFDYLFAKKHGGTVILRIEDTDQGRLVEGAIEGMLTVFGEVGIVFDEGYYLDNGQLRERGNFGPYLQSKRLDLYKKYVDELVASGHAYHCFCSEERLEELRREQVALKKPPMYDRKCRNLSDSEIVTKKKEFSDEGKSSVIRQAIPESGTTEVSDLIYGTISYQNSTLDDQVLMKSDGYPTYHLAVVVDDHLMEISHVLRGEEWLPSTPKHVLLYQSFGWQAPAVAHLPLILNTDKTKMSKRKGDVSVASYLQKGYLKEALLNFLALLGWNPKTEQEIFSLDELAEAFDLSSVNKAGAVFDVTKLDWMNSQYLRKLTLEQLTEKLLPYWKEAGLKTEGWPTGYLTAVAGLEQERLKKLSDIVERTAYFFAAPTFTDPSAIVWKKSTAQDAKKKLTDLSALVTDMGEKVTDKAVFEEKVKAYIASSGADNGSVLWPLRFAITGQAMSPGPFEVASTLALGWGSGEVSKRLLAAAELL